MREEDCYLVRDTKTYCSHGIGIFEETAGFPTAIIHAVFSELNFDWKWNGQICWSKAEVLYLLLKSSSPSNIPPGEEEKNFLLLASFSAGWASNSETPCAVDSPAGSRLCSQCSWHDLGTVPPLKNIVFMQCEMLLVQPQETKGKLGVAAFVDGRCDKQWQTLGGVCGWQTGMFFLAVLLCSSGIWTGYSHSPKAQCIPLSPRIAVSKVLLL